MIRLLITLSLVLLLVYFMFSLYGKNINKIHELIGQGKAETQNIAENKNLHTAMDSIKAKAQEAADKYAQSTEKKLSELESSQSK